MTHELTDKVLAELERLHREATPGEWYVKRRYSNDCEIVPRITCKPDDDRGCGWIADIIGAPYLGHKTTLPNAYLIVAMRNVLPALITAARRVRELEKIIDTLDDAPELNPNNYTHDEVCDLNVAVINTILAARHLEAQ